MAFTMNITRDKVWPPYDDIGVKIKEYTDKIDFITSASILNGFDYEYESTNPKTRSVEKTKYHFSYKSDDQQNFSTQNEMALLVANNTIAKLQQQLAAALTKQSGTATMDEAVAAIDSGLSDAIGDTANFTTSWQGHTEDGQAVTLQFNFDQFIKFTVAAGMHKQTAIGTGWLRKAQFRACKTEDELEALAKSMNLDQLILEARDIYEKLNLTPDHLY